MNARGNVLGDLRAEFDHPMLDSAFFSSPDYRTLIESSDKTLVVGRRGTGKSALAYKLAKYWEAQPGAVVIKVSVDEDQVIGTRPLVELFGPKFLHIRAGARLAWRYTLFMEAAAALCQNYKFARSDAHPELSARVKVWKSRGATPMARLRHTLRDLVQQDSDPAYRIGDLASALDLDSLRDVLRNGLDQSGTRLILLIDRLDEGYEPDETGVALIDGCAYAASDLNDSHISMLLVTFLRDNIFRAVSQFDPDFSRNLEGPVLRLHWDEYNLFNLICNRLRIAFAIKAEKDLSVWNSKTAKGLQGMDGFKMCLRLTLYRPRDLIQLLNGALLHAKQQDRDEMIDLDVEAAAKEISATRLNDLIKEYEAIVPGLSHFVFAFRNHDPEVSLSEATSILGRVLSEQFRDPAVQQMLEILGDPLEVVRSLYSVGFIGLRDSVSDTFVFCHDGRNPNKWFEPGDRLLIHPCFWIALNLTRSSISKEEAEVIYDEYDVGVVSETPKFRAARIDGIVAELHDIPAGADGSSRFEEWCQTAVRIVFAGPLQNVELHPNRDAPQRRDIVARNVSETGVWKQIYDDYRVRQVIFEVKNYEGLGASDYRQLMSYLSEEYGKLGFFITRGGDQKHLPESERAFAKEMKDRHGAVLIKLTTGFLADLLLKLRKPQKHSAPEKALAWLLDEYTRVMFAGGSIPRKMKRH